MERETVSPSVPLGVMDTVFTIGLFVMTLLTIALMAVFALRPESTAPKCPRCDASLKAGLATCPRCKLPVS